VTPIGYRGADASCAATWDVEKYLLQNDKPSCCASSLGRPPFTRLMEADEASSDRSLRGVTALDSAAR
jgi:hypothetical protein